MKRNSINANTYSINTRYNEGEQTRNITYSLRCTFNLKDSYNYGHIT
jgi:hypothetical protein